MTDVKICGITTPEAMTAAIDGGARFAGLVFHAPSPRFVETEIAGYLARYVPTGVRTVGLFVDPDNAALEDVLNTVQLDMIQLHGHESPGRVSEIKTAFGMPVIKALPVSGESDLEKVPGYEAAADWLMFDAKSGGSGETFDWSILQQYLQESPLSKPWFLAGGLHAENITAALDVLSPSALDISSGVESSRGVKDPEKIRTFLTKAAQL